MVSAHPVPPLPRPTPLTAPFWAAAREHSLRLQRCDRCGRLRFYPAAGCPACGAPECSWMALSGRGRVYSWIVVHRTFHPAWKTRVPYTTGIVELAEQPGLLVPGLLTGLAAGEITAGLEVEAWFEDINDEIAIPRWRPCAGSRIHVE